MKATIYLLIALSIFPFSGCKDNSIEVHITGRIAPFDDNNDYSIFILENDVYQNKVLDVIENENISQGRVDFRFKYNLNFKGILEVRVNDTVRCILVPGQSDYLKNPVTGAVSRIQIVENRSDLHVKIENVPFDLDFSKQRLFDYNTKFLNPVIKIEKNYQKISGRIDSLPEGSRLVILADGGKKVKQYDFHSPNFEFDTPFKMDYLNIYIHSRYGWQRHLKEYDIGKLSLNFQ